MDPQRDARERALSIAVELRALLRLALPIVVTQVGTMALGVVDTLMVGHLSVDALAAAALGNVWIYGTLVLGMGVMLGIDPIVTQAHGAGDGERSGLALQRGLVLALLLSPLIGLLWWLCEPALIFFGQSPTLAALAGDYVGVQIPSIPAFLGFFALRQYLQGRGVVRPAMWVILAANLLNLAGNRLLIFGGLGLPGYGLEGAAAATAFTRYALFFGLATAIRALGLHRGAWPRWSRAVLAPAGLAEILAFGLPVGLHLGLEMWAFQAAALLAGRLGEVPLAAHTIVLNLASLSFNVPLGVSMAAVTRVGNLLGAGRYDDAQRAAGVALGIGAGVMAVAAVLFIALRDLLPDAYSDDAAVIALAAGLLPVAAAFQLFDGLQVVGGGILRGMGRTRPAAVFNLVGYYVLGLPLAIWLAFPFGQDLGVSGLWWGLTLALGVIAALLVLWIRRRGPASLAPRVGA
ncbi:MAG: MATE family efflux transporter [Myxococcales bacterium]|nr:MATE family efflux transporter [Myxococcales bacterium]MCB9701170.1 MATE family efflux transporter [Myxococcales bacterium]